MKPFSIAANIKMSQGVTLTEYQKGIPVTVSGGEKRDDLLKESLGKKRMKKSEYL